MTSSQNILHNLQSVAIEAAYAAGQLLRINFDRTKQLSYKEGTHNIVTDSDLASEHLIIEIIRKHYPNHSILTEESGSHLSQSGYRWIVDPLDGTVNFAHGVPIFSVSIAVEYNGAILAGVVYQPLLEELFTAICGEGAQLNDTQISVSMCQRLDDAFLVTGFPYNITSYPEYREWHFPSLVSRGIPIRRLGSSALDLAYVAAGRFDGFWEVGLHPWDIAAGILLVREAGGVVTSYEGSPHTLDNRTIIATNGHIHDELLDFLKGKHHAV